MQIWTSPRNEPTLVEVDVGQMFSRFQVPEGIATAFSCAVGRDNSRTIIQSKQITCWFHRLSFRVMTFHNLTMACGLKSYIIVIAWIVGPSKCLLKLQIFVGRIPAFVSAGDSLGSSPVSLWCRSKKAPFFGHPKSIPPTSCHCGNPQMLGRLHKEDTSWRHWTLIALRPQYHMDPYGPWTLETSSE